MIQNLGYIDDFFPLVRNPGIDAAISAANEPPITSAN
jgi:hypothetical protein